jgi:hypothetical protein
MTVQGHPEFTAEIMRELLGKAYFSGVLNKDLFEDSIRRVDNITMVLSRRASRETRNKWK